MAKVMAVLASAQSDEFWYSSHLWIYR